MSCCTDHMCNSIDHPFQNAYSKFHSENQILCIVQFECLPSLFLIRGYTCTPTSVKLLKMKKSI